MNKTVLKWLGGVIAEHTLLKMVATVPLAYFAGLAANAKKGVDAVFDALPPLFWPILAALILAAVIYPGFIAPVRKKYHERKKRKENLLRHTYWMVKHAVNPSILDELNPDRGNRDKLFAIAQSTAYNFVSDCKEEGWWKDVSHPPPIKDQDTLREWDKHLSALREGCS